MRKTRFSHATPRFLGACFACLAAGALLGSAITGLHAEMEIPTKHRGVTVTSLGVLPEDSLKAQIGLSGYVLQMREITLEPGGAIARHSHANRPGLVQMIAGTWVEGRPGGTQAYGAGNETAILEDKDTEHWFWNTGSEPATAIVCDMVPPS